MAFNFFGIGQSSEDRQRKADTKARLDKKTEDFVKRQNDTEALRKKNEDLRKERLRLGRSPGRRQTLLSLDQNSSKNLLQGF